MPRWVWLPISLIVISVRWLAARSRAQLGQLPVGGQRLTPDDGVLPPHVAGPARPV